MTRWEGRTLFSCDLVFPSNIVSTSSFLLLLKCYTFCSNPSCHNSHNMESLVDTKQHVDKKQ